MKIKALLFDMDGLMVDTERLYFETEREVATQYGKVLEDTTLWKMMGRRPIESMQVFIEDLKLDVSPEEALVERDGMMLEKMKKDLVPMKGLYDILTGFHSLARMAVVTGAKSDFLYFIIDKLDIRKYFNILQSSEGIKNGKPDPEIYLTAIEKLGLAPHECAVLEDSSNGARAGKSAGCYTIAIPSEYSKTQDFSFVDFIATDLIDARDHLLNIQ